MTQTVLIAGASGRFGSHAKVAFQNAGWEVRVFDRSNQSLIEAAAKMDVIVNAMNPPDYKNWDIEIPRITQDVIAAAKAHDSTVLLPGNVYNFGKLAGPWREKTPQVAASRKGQIRIDMEKAYRASGVQTINLRAGDFMGGDARGTWLDLVMLKSLAKGKFVYPGNPDVPHAWANLPDLGRAAVGLAEKRGALPVYSDIHFEGFTVTGTQMMKAIEEVLGRSLKMSSMPWWPIRIASPFWPLGRELLEMRYLWDHPHWLESASFSEVLPQFESTGINEVMAEILPVDVYPNKAMIGTQSFA